MALFRIPAASHDAPSRVVQAANTARQLGCTDVTAGYEPPSDTYVVNGEPPAVPDSPQTLCPYS
jgi:hypothetical protein